MPTTATARSAQDQRGGSVIANVFEVLRCFTSDAPDQGVTEIARRVGLHKSSVSRILSTLEAEGIVERDERTRRYRLGLGLIGIAAPLLASLDVRRIAVPELVALRDRTGETAALTVWDGQESVSVEQVASKRNVKQTSALGSRYGTGLSASVQVFCAQEEESRVRELLARGDLGFDEPMAAEAYLERLEEVRRTGFALNDGETLPDEAAAAAPVLDHRGLCVGALLLAAPRFRVSRAQLEELGMQTRAAADAVSRRMGADVPRR